MAVKGKMNFLLYFAAVPLYGLCFPRILQGRMYEIRGHTEIPLVLSQQGGAEFFFNPFIPGIHRQGFDFQYPDHPACR